MGAGGAETRGGRGQAAACRLRSLHSPNFWCEWQFLQRVTKDCANEFHRLERAIATEFLPALLQEVTAAERLLYGLPVRCGGMGVADPTTTADAAYRTSRAAASHLVSAIRGASPFELATHRQQMEEARAAYKKAKQEETKARAAEVISELPTAQAKAAQRAADFKSGQWLNMMCSAANGSVLSRQEWRDGWAVRYGKEAKDLPAVCDAPACRQKNSIEHALNCKHGGLVIRRHNELRDELGQLCKLGYAHVMKEPVTKVGDSTKPLDHADRDGRRGDLCVRGAFASQTDCVMDLTVMNLDAKSRCKSSTAAALSGGEREKIRKHQQACKDMRADFVPFVVSTDGCMGEQAQKFLRRLGRRLAEKWGRAYSDVAGFLFSRMSISIVRATSMCIRATRNPIQARRWCMDDGAALDIMLE